MPSYPPNKKPSFLETVLTAIIMISAGNRVLTPLPSFTSQGSDQGRLRGEQKADEAAHGPEEPCYQASSWQESLGPGFGLPTW